VALTARAQDGRGVGSRPGRTAAPDAGSRAALRDALSIAAVWAALIIISTAVRSDFLSQQTLLAVTFTMAVAGVMAVAQSVVVVGGGLLDLSLPYILVFAAWATVTLLDHGMPTAVAVAGGVVAGAAWGALNSAVIIWGRLNPIIVTLATGSGGLAFMTIFFQSAQIPAGSGLRHFGKSRFLGLPDIFWPMLALILLAGCAIMYTRWGRRLIATGGNPAAAKARGVSLRRVRFATFVGAGAITGLAGVLFASVNPTFGPASGQNFQLTVIAAVILAGFSLAGGKGNPLILLLSVGFLSTIPASIGFFGLAPQWSMVFQGALLIGAVGADGYRLKRGSR
jgi:ribose transport system permease protein